MELLLSICVPTYNRAAMLRVMLGAVLPQVAAEEGAVELCLSDNASPDATQEVVRDAMAICPFRHSRNGVNLGVFRNFDRVANQMAAGEYVWVLGDDDLVRPGAVRRVLAAIRANRETDAFYVNFNTARHSEHWPASAPGGYDGPFDSTVHADTTSRRVAAWEELIDANSSYCTQVYVHVLRRTIWRGLSHKGSFGRPYSSFRWTWAHTCMAAQAMWGRPAYFIGEPAVTIFNRETEWWSEAPRIILEHLPDLLRFYARLGLPEDKVAELEQSVDAAGVLFLQNLLQGKEPRAASSPLGFVARRWYRFRTWRLLWEARQAIQAERRLSRAA